MAVEPKRIKIAPGTSLDTILEEAKTTPIILEKDGVTFTLQADGSGDIWAGYDPAKVTAALAATAGTWGDSDGEKLLAGLYCARDEGSRPRDRP